MPSGVLSMDKGTVRGLIGAKIFKVQVQTKGGPQIAEFSLELSTGLTLSTLAGER